MRKRWEAPFLATLVGGILVATSIPALQSMSLPLCGTRITITKYIVPSLLVLLSESLVQRDQVLVVVTVEGKLGTGVTNVRACNDDDEVEASATSVADERASNEVTTADSSV